MSANLDNGVMLGALGSAHSRTSTPIVPPTGMIIAAIQVLTTTTFTSLVAQEPTRFINQVEAANNHTVDGAAAQTVDEGSGGQTFVGATPAGVTLYGRWTKVQSTSVAGSGFICYFGY